MSETVDPDPTGEVERRRAIGQAHAGSAPGAGQDEASECLAGVVKGAKFDSPGSWAVKVMFPL